jgi:CrcB protein
MIINVSGSLLIGCAIGLAASRLALTPTLRLFVVTGFLGGYTTFSTFSYETYELINAGSLWRGMANAAGSVLLGFLAVVLGIWLARLAP